MACAATIRSRISREVGNDGNVEVTSLNALGDGSRGAERARVLRDVVAAKHHLQKIIAPPPWLTIRLWKVPPLSHCSMA